MERCFYILCCCCCLLVDSYPKPARAYLPGGFITLSSSFRNRQMEARHVAPSRSMRVHTFVRINPGVHSCRREQSNTANTKEEEKSKPTQRRKKKKKKTQSPSKSISNSHVSASTQRHKIWSGVSGLVKKPWGLEEATRDDHRYYMHCGSVDLLLLVLLLYARFIDLMASRSAAFSFSPASLVGSSRKTSREASMHKHFLVVSCDRRSDLYASLAARILGPPTTFNAAKLKVEFIGEEINKQPFRRIPRAYTLTHCDFTANLTLAVSNTINSEQLRSWQTTLQRDDVVAEWKDINGEISLHVHCYVSGANLLQELAAGFRYHIFSKELPLVLKAVIYGDAALFAEHPELMEAKVWVHFHSNSRKYNRIERWGPLEEAIKRNLLDDRFDELQSAITERRRKWASPETIFNALIALLL